MPDSAALGELDINTVKKPCQARHILQAFAGLIRDQGQGAVAVKPLAEYRLHVEFADGTQGEVDLSDRLFGPVFEPLRSSELFEQVEIDEFGVVCWPNGADLAPDALYETIAGALT